MKRPLRGRGALSNRASRFLPRETRIEDDGWGNIERLLDEDGRPRTRVTAERTKTILTRNDSPDVYFDRSINPYKGCEHGCVYCFARSTHAYLDLSPGLDFETKIFSKPDAAERLRVELARKGYEPQVIAIGTNTDPYQPVERELRITRSILEVLDECAHPVALVTKSRGILRDVDILRSLAERDLVRVMMSITTLDASLAGALEPRAAAPAARLDTLRRLHEAGIPVGVMVSPVIPSLTDTEVESILGAAYDAGARWASTILLRLPREVADLFDEWLAEHVPDRREHVLSLLREAHGGELYRSDFGQRGRGSGPWAVMLHERFRLAARRLGMEVDSADTRSGLRTDLFQAPLERGGQMGLF